MYNIVVLLLIISCIGVIAWGLITYVPMPPIFRGIIIVVAAVAMLLWLANSLGSQRGMRFGSLSPEVQRAEIEQQTTVTVY